MAGLGWTGTSPYGLQSTLRQQVLDRLAQEQQGFQNNITERELALREQQAQELAAEHQQAMAERTQAANDSAAGKAAGTLSIGQSIPEGIAGRLRGSMLGASVQDNPALTQPPASALGGEAMTQPDVQPGSQPGAVWQGTDAQKTDAEQKTLRGRLVADPNLTPRERLMIGMENAGLKVPAGMDPTTKTPTHLVPVAKGGGAVYMNEAEAAGQPVYERPQQTPTVTIQTVDDQGNPVTRVVTKKDALGKDFAARPSAADAQHARTNKETLDTLDQLDQAIAAAKDLIGPGEGRVSNIEQMAGNADPRIQALGVKMKAAKMRVDHAVTGSVRAGASPLMMQQWDNILANKITPEGLTAGVQAMREIVGGSNTSSGTVHMKAPDGRDLNVPASDVERLKGLGATLVGK